MTLDNIEFTDREKAIMRGEDPDTIQPDSTPQEAEPVVEASEAADAAPLTGGQEVGPEDREVVSGTEAASGSVQDTSWIDDSIRDRAKDYGISDEQLKDFSGPDDFLKAAMVWDRKLSKFWQQQPQQTQQPQQAQPETKQETTQKEEEDELDPERLRREKFDDVTIRVAERLKAEREMRAKIEAEHAQMRQRFEAMDRERAEQAMRMQVNAALDAFDEKRFGRTFDKEGRIVRLSKEAAENRARLYEEADSIVRGIAAKAMAEGRDPREVMPSLQTVLRRAELALFGEEIIKEQKAKVRTGLEAQSRQRRPVGSTRPPSAAAKAQGRPSSPTSESDYAKEIANSPELVKFWEAAANG